MSSTLATITATATAATSTNSAEAIRVSASAAVKSLSKAIAEGNQANPPAFKYVGLALAVGSGFLIGSSFVFKKKGLLAAQRKFETSAGEGHAYLKSPMWWTGMIVMVFGEVFNFVAYAFADAVLVTPLGALSVVICAVLSSIFLKEKLTLFGKVGCFLCIVGSVIIALNAPTSHVGGQITEFQKLFLAPGFLAWAGVCIATALVLVFYFAPRYGKKNMMIYITVCSLIGGLSVSVTSGLGSAILLSIRGQNQFKHWFIYFLLGFVVITLLVEINYLNKALELFNTATVTPTYYVIFTGATLITSIILQKGLDASPLDIATLVMGFLVICAGIVLLQLSKIDPEDLTDKPGLDRGTTLLIRASHSVISHGEKTDMSAWEDPGVDTVRGGMGIMGSMIRARSSRRLSSASSWSRRHHSAADEYTLRSRNNVPLTTHGAGDIERYQLHDAPLSPRGFNPEHLAAPGTPSRRGTTIQFEPGADSPHGHHASTTPRGSVGAAGGVSQFGALDQTHTLHPIKESLDGSGRSGQSSNPPRSPGYVDPYAPQTHSPLSPSLQSSNVQNMWDNPSYSASPDASPESEADEYSIRAVASSAGADQRGSSARSKAKDYPKIKPRSASKGLSKTSSDSDSAEELLSPRLGYR